MQVIYKYEVLPNDTFTIKTPLFAKILSVQTQHGKPMIWMLVDTSSVQVERTFEVIGTGHEIKKLDDTQERVYAGAFQLHGGALVFHLFEIVNVFKLK